MHYSNPVPTMRMLEVIYTEETTQETIDICCMVGEAQDKAISLVRDKPGTYGFILNRVFAAAFREGLKIVEDGIATRCESRTNRVRFRSCVFLDDETCRPLSECGHAVFTQTS